MATISSNNTKKEKSLLEIFHIVYRKKIIIISSAILCLILAFLYNKFSTPVFESNALLKKENTEGARTDELYEIVRLQTMDQVGTEIELIKSAAVLGRVVDELKLCVELKEVIDPIGNPYELNNVFIDFPDSGNSYAKQIGFSLPMFKNVELKNKNAEHELYIEKKGENLFELRDIEGNKVITSLNTSKASILDTSEAFFVTDAVDSILAMEQHPGRIIFNTDFAQFEFSWNDAPVGSKIYFNINNHHKFLSGFSKSIFVTGGSGNLFRLHVRSSSPLACKVIATIIIRSFREARMEQQKQTVHYSFQFVDEQLTEVQKKLLDAESNLSNFKASGQIMTISGHTEELMAYMSTLEAEKLQVDILLSDYKNKLEALKKELQGSEYFDQAFLEPSGEFQPNSPFATLMGHLADLELQKLELIQERTENHPDVVSLNEQILATRKKLTTYNQHTVTSLQIIINTLEKKLLKISILMSRYEEKLHQLPAQENRMARLVREKDVFEKIFKLLLDKREEMRVAELSKLQDIVVIDQPYKPLTPIRPRKMMNMVIALVIGGFIGIVSIFLIELRNTRLINIDDLEEEFKIPIFALIPNYDKDIIRRINNPVNNKDRFVTLMGDNLGIRESYRLLKTKLHQLDIREKTLLVASCEENTGKTSIVANLAITMAKEGKKILIVDCDLRKTELSKMFDVPLNSPGLIDFITKGGSPAIYTRVLKKLDILPAGGVREDSSSLLSSDRMKSLFKAIDTSVYNYIIIDTPPVTRVVDTLILGQSVRNAILVVRPDISMKEAVISGIQEMNHAKIKIRGIVANAVEIQKSYYYRYRYGYGYGYTSGDEKRSSNKKRVKIAETSVNLLG